MSNMQIGLLGRKLGMTQIYNNDGDVVPVTVIETTSNRVIRVKKSDAADGYASVQVGFGTRKATRITKALAGHAALAGTTAPRTLRELRVPDELAGTFQPGQVLSAADFFSEGARVDITGTSKGRGFAGVFKRYNFAGFESSHGTHEYFRHGGSIGTRLTPGMTLKGKKMPGHMGAERVTVQNLRVIKVDAETGHVFVRGAVPGPTGATVLLRKSVKDAARAAHKAKKGK